MTTLNDNKLHGDPGIEAHALHHEVPVSSEGATPMQRDRATTIFEKGAAGRRAFVAPALDVPEVEATKLLPPAFRHPMATGTSNRSTSSGKRALDEHG